MRGPHNIWRLIRTGATFERTGAMHIALEAMDVHPRLRLAARIVGRPFRWLGFRGDPSLPPITRAITALGPAYIKFGQVMSTRPDVVGQGLADELRVLQDKLPPFDIELAKATIAADFDKPVDELFSEFSEPVAAASIAQVHRARMAETGEEVAVKVLRPGIERAFRRDIDAFYFAASIIERISPASRRLRPTEVVAHFESVVLGELDLRLESSAAAEFATNTEGDKGFRLPKSVWSLSSRRVLTQTWAEGIPLGDVAALRSAGHDCAALAARVLQLFLSHALRDGYFHADMHQGNMKVAENGDIIAYDFGIMGAIDAYTRRVYAEILMGFIRRDYVRVAEVHFEAGYVPRDQDMHEFARALRAVGEPIFGMEATHISMARVLAYLFEVTERFGMQTRTELILLQRTMVVVEGVARSLDPHINIWSVSQPIVEAYVRQNVGPVAFGRDLVKTMQVLARFGPKLPLIAENLLIRQSGVELQGPARSGRAWVWPMLTGAALMAAGIALARFLHL